MKRSICADGCCEYQTIFYNRKKNSLKFWTQRYVSPFGRAIPPRGDCESPSPFGRGGVAPEFGRLAPLELESNSHPIRVVCEFPESSVEENRFSSKPQKAGIFITSSNEDSKTTKVLLVQSKGQFWGPPKGSLNPGETVIDAAIREVKEETGIEFDKENIGEIKASKGSCYYFHVNMDEIPVSIQTSIEDNDANGIGWFKVECLDNLIKSGKIQINQHCAMLIRKILGYAISSNWGVQLPRLSRSNFIKI